MGCGGGGTAKEDNSKGGVSISTGAPYLLLVSYQTPRFAELGEVEIDALEKSPYDGTAVRLNEPVDLEVPSFSGFKERIDFLNDNSEKRFWPWVFANRIVAPAKANSDKAAAEYYKKANTIELNEIGAPMSDFLSTFRVALKIAKETNSPGIVLDLEFFNNYDCYSISYVSTRKKIPPADVTAMLAGIGDRMAAVMAEEYQDVVVWFLTTGLSVPDFEVTSGGQFYYIAPAYIVLGMVEGAKKRGLWARFVDGDKTSIGLYSKDLMDLETKINRRERAVAPVMSKYTDILLPGAAVAPWHDLGLIKGWIKQGVGEKTFYNDISDFGSTFDCLLSAYPYVWIYASSDAGYNPYNPDIAQLYNNELVKTKMKFWHRK